ncbi:MAG TPA: hypothetical protein V6D09_19130 [Leptolyngbyaceae cyanobacterium]
MEPIQLSLFSNLPPGRATRPETLVMDAPTLVRWKPQIYDYLAAGEGESASTANHVV